MPLPSLSRPSTLVLLTFSALQTVKAMLLLAPKLTQNVLEDDLMKHFAKLQVRVSVSR